MAESGQQSAFISIYHKRVPVTAEMKIELHRMNSTLRAKMRKERRCAQKDYLQCCGDCLSCYWRRKGIYVSLDSLHHEEFSGACRNSFVPDKIHIK